MWSLGNDSTAEEPNASQMGLAWLVPLWVDRDQEVWLSHSSHFQQTTFEAFYENMEAAGVFSIQACSPSLPALLHKLSQSDHL